MTGFKVKVNNKMKTIAAKVEANVTGNALAAGAAILQREIMQQAMSMAIWDTGNLINAHTRRRVSKDSWEVVSPAEYSIYVHEGTSHMAARPWLNIGTMNAERPIIEMIQRAVDGAI